MISIRYGCVGGRGLLLACTSWLAANPSAVAAEENDVDAIRAEIAQQRADLEARLKRLDALEARLAAATGDKTIAAPQADAGVPDSGPEEKIDLVAQLTDLPEATSEQVLDQVTPASIGRGEEFIDPDFKKSIPLFGSNLRFAFGGYAKLDLIQDFSGSGDKRQFIIDGIPVNGSPQPGSYFHAEVDETRFNFEIRDTSPGAPHNRAVIELDFYSSGHVSRLRHAYIEYGPLLVGQTWTTLTELRALPMIIDFAAGDSLYGGRTQQIRLQMQKGDWDWAMALEGFGDGNIENLAGTPGVARSNFPVLVGRASREWDGGLFVLGGSIGQNRWDGDKSQGYGDATSIRWNAMAASRIYLDRSHKSFLGLQASYTVGSTNEIITFGNAGTPAAVLMPDGRLKNIKAWSTSIGGHFDLGNKWSTNVHYAYANLINTGGLPIDITRSGHAAHINLIYDLNSRIRTGIEYMYGIRKLVDGSDGDASRLQYAIFYYF